MSEEVGRVGDRQGDRFAGYEVRNGRGEDRTQQRGMESVKLCIPEVQ